MKIKLSNLKKLVPRDDPGALQRFNTFCKMNDQQDVLVGREVCEHVLHGGGKLLEQLFGKKGGSDQQKRLKEIRNSTAEDRSPRDNLFSNITTLIDERYQSYRKNVLPAKKAYENLYRTLERSGAGQDLLDQLGYYFVDWVRKGRACADQASHGPCKAKKCVWQKDKRTCEDKDKYVLLNTIRPGQPQEKINSFECFFKVLNGGSCQTKQDAREEAAKNQMAKKSVQERGKISGFGQISDNDEY